MPFLFFHNPLARLVFPFLSICLTAAAASSEHFTNPPDGVSDLTYTRQSIIQVTWQSNLDRVALTLWHGDAKDFEYLPNSANISNTGSYPWQVDSTANINNETFSFVIFHPGNTTAAFSSNQFSIVDTTTTSTSASTSSTSSSSSATTFITSTSSTSSAVSSTQSSSSASPTAVTHSGISQGAKAGIGVGIGIGIPLILALGIFLGWRFRGGRVTGENSGDGRHAAQNTPLNGGAGELQPTRQEPPKPATNNWDGSRAAPQELPEMRVNELNSRPLHQLE